MFLALFNILRSPLPFGKPILASAEKYDQSKRTVFDLLRRPSVGSVRVPINCVMHCYAHCRVDVSSADTPMNIMLA
jgi:hypothetical protein